MSIESRFAPRLAGLTATAVVLLGTNACTGNLDPVSRADIVVQPLEVEGAGFVPTQLNAGQLEAGVQAGVDYYNHASDNHLGNASVAAGKSMKLRVDGITKVGDLCTGDAKRKFLAAADKATHHKDTQRVVFVTNATDVDKTCLTEGVEDTGRLIAIFGDKNLNKKTVGHELGHTEGLNHIDAWKCPRPANLTTDCTSVPYGDPTKLMSYEYDDFDAVEPLTAFQLLHLGKIRNEQVMKISGPQTTAVELSLPSIKDDKTKAVVVDVGGVGNETSIDPLKCAQKAVLQVDKEPYTDKSGAVVQATVLKVYTQGDRQGAPVANLMRLSTNEQFFGLGYQNAQTVHIGRVTLRLTFDKAQQGKLIQDTTKMTVGVSYQGSPPQLGVTNCH